MTRQAIQLVLEQGLLAITLPEKPAYQPYHLAPAGRKFFQQTHDAQ